MSLLYGVELCLLQLRQAARARDELMLQLILDWGLFARRRYQPMGPGAIRLCPAVRRSGDEGLRESDHGVAPQRRVDLAITYTVCRVASTATR
jgi:hypothetical protein